MAGRVIIISGPPGAGKTSVASVLATEAARSVHLVSDWFYRWIVAGFVPPHEPASKQQNSVVMKAVTDAAATYASGGFDVYWDGVVGPWWLDRIYADLAARALGFEYVVLRPSKQTAIARVHARGDSDETTGVTVMHDQFSELGRHERFIVNSDGPLPEVIEAVRRAIADPNSRYSPS